MRLGSAVKITRGRGNRTERISFYQFRNLMSQLQRNTGKRIIYVNSIFPKGEWPRKRPTGGRGDIIIRREKRIALPERFLFLESFGPVIEVVEVFFGRSNRKSPYKAFVFNGFIIAEHIDYGNALYVFRGSFEDFLKEVELSKWEICSGQSSTFVQRINHKGDWQKRTSKTVATLEKIEKAKFIEDLKETLIDKFWQLFPVKGMIV